MAGNSELFQQKMEAGYGAAWDQDWPTAIREFSQAVQMNPQDAEAHKQLGLALLNADRLEDALRVYMKAHNLDPNDPVPLEKGADVLERMGRLKEAAQQYITVSDIYIKSDQRDLNKAIRNWERATQLSPGMASIHARLAQAYERVGDKKQALYQYLMVAYNFGRSSDSDKARRAVEHALRIDKRHSQALNMLRALRSDGELTLPDPPEGTELETETEHDPLMKERHVGAADPRGPMGEAMTEALEALAAHVMETGELDVAGADALQGMQLQRQDHMKEAIESYQRASAHFRHPALKMNLGALLFLDDQPAEAIKHLSEAITHPSLSAGAMHAMGYSYYKLGEHKKASRYLIQSLQAVDTKLATDQNEINELTNIYGDLLDALDGRTNDTLEAVNRRFIGLLSGTDWKQRIPDTRRHLEEVMRTEGGDAAFDTFAFGSDELPAKVTQIDAYIRKGLLVMAMDEAHNAVQIAPHYLPVHVRMAEILMREGRLRQAILKYNIIARTYMAREENDRAASILAEVLEMAPMDISVRTNLIKLLESENRHEAVLDQYIEQARTYNQLGNFDLSRETYQRAERLCAEINAPPEKMVTIKHSLADMAQIRLETRQALKFYEEIIAIIPGDERAYRMLIDLNYSLANQVDAIKYLDQMLGIYARRKQISKIVQLLEDLVRLYPTDTGLRSRLAAIYKQLGRKREAIEQLDTLGELQLEAGMHNDACQTIKQIIALKPDNIEDYQELLEQLSRK